MVKKNWKNRGGKKKSYAVLVVLIVVGVLLFSYNDGSLLNNNVVGKAVGGSSGVIGRLDRADNDIIAGWSLNEKRMDKPSIVWIYVDNERVSSMITNEYRPDIATEFSNSHANSGFYLFTKYLNLPMGTHVVRVYGYDEVSEYGGKGGTLSELSGSPKYLTVSNNKPKGIVEDVTNSRIKGWAFDIDSLGEKLRLRVVDRSGSVLKEMDHNRFQRLDVADMFDINDLNTGFYIKDLILHNGAEIYLEAYDSEVSEWVRLNKSPVVVGYSYIEGQGTRPYTF